MTTTTIPQANDLLSEHDLTRPPYSLSARTLQNWRVRGEGPPYVKLEGLVRYRRGDLEAWIDSRVVLPRG